MSTENPAWQALVKKLTDINLERTMALTAADVFTITDVKGIQHQFRRRKCSVKEYFEIRQLDEESKRVKVGDSETFSQKVANMYRKAAEYYLGMDAAIFWDLHFFEIKEILDTLHWEQMNGRPLSQKT